MKSNSFIRESYREIDQRIDESFCKIIHELTRMNDTLQRMIDYESSIVVAESSITSETDLIVFCQPYVMGIQQPLEVVMRQSDINDKLISLPESTKVNSSTQTLRNHSVMSTKFIFELLFINEIDSWPKQTVAPHLWDTTPYDPGGYFICANYNLEDKVVVDEWSNNTCIR